MALSNPRDVFGIHSIMFYDRADGSFYGPELRVLGGSELNFTGEVVELTGGSSQFPNDVAEGKVNAEMSLTLREYPDYLFQLFSGATPVTTALTVGQVTAGANKKGTSIISATNGISAVSATAGDEADLKTGKYLIKATAAATADVYISSSIDVAGSLLLTDGHKVGTISLATTAVDATFGLTFTKVGTPAFVTGDTATFEVINNKATSVTTVTIGNSAATFPDFGAILYAQKKGTAEIFEIDVFKVKAVGQPILMKEKAFSEYSVTAKCSYDSAKDGVFSLRMIK